MTEPDQVLDELAGAADAVALDEVAVESRDRAVDQDERDVVARQKAELRPRTVADGRDQHALDLEGDHVLEVAALALEVALRVAEDDVVAGAPGDLLDAADDEGEERVGDVRHDHSEGARLALDQPAGEPVGDVAELRDRRLHAPARVGTDAGAVVDDARNGHRRNTGVARNVVDRHSHGRVIAAGWAGDRYHTIRPRAPRISEKQRA